MKKHTTLFDLAGERGYSFLHGRVSETGILARVFLKLIINRKITVDAVQDLLERYTADPVNCVHPSKRLSVRGNLIKELGKPQMTWRVFLKGLRLLRVVKFRISVKIWFADSEPTEASFQTRLIPSVPVIDDEPEFDETLTAKNIAVPRTPGVVNRQFHGPTSRVFLETMERSQYEEGDNDE